ncbi:MAG: phosphotransferase [Deltaproteobacteria bacterium]|nr:phosphotransferase [Deltaproteobacteria bacterium]
MVSSHIVMPSFSNPRWILPNDKNLIRNCGNIVKPSSLKAKTAWRVTQALNIAGRPELVFPDRIVVAVRAGSKNPVGVLKSFLSKVMDNDGIDIVLYTGANGYYYQKFTAQIMERSRGTIAYAKIGSTDQARKRVEDESRALKELDALRLTRMKTPAHVFYGTMNGTGDAVLLQTPPPPGFSDVERGLDERHIGALSELFEKTRHGVKGSDVLARAEAALKTLPGERGNRKKLFDAVERGLSKLCPALEGKELRFGLSHGDFTPWNIYLKGTEMFVFDWELAKIRAPLWDAYNFIVHSEHLIFGKGAKEIFALLKGERYSRLTGLYGEKTGLGAHDARVLLPLYLTEVLLYYIDLVSKYELEGTKEGIEGEVALMISELLRLALADIGNA